jgi:amino acid adenylation domain-containing protein
MNAADPTAGVRIIPAEQQAIRAKCFHPTGTFVEFTADEIEQSIPDRFEKIVRLYPDRLAVKTKNDSVSYEALNRAANRIARTILEQHGQRGEPIAIMFGHSVNAIAAIIGVLKSGNIYLPLNPSDPVPKIAAALENSQAALLMSDGRGIALLKDVRRASSSTLNIDEISPRMADQNLGLRLSGETMTYLMYTSGSTAEPKGVLQNHRNVLQKIMTESDDFRICIDDRVVLLYSLAFSASVRPIFCALLNGAGLFPFDVKEEAIRSLPKWLIEERISLHFSTPTLFRQLIAARGGEEIFSTVRVVYLGSEPVTRSDVESFKKHFGPGCVLVNTMASSETGTALKYFVGQEIEIDGDSVPVGYAARGKEVLLLNEQGAEITVGEIGEIAVKSRYLAPGYWRNSDLTRAKFLPDPEGGDKRTYLTGDLGRMRPDGCLEYLGRKDSRARIKGLWIETAQIEAALTSMQDIKQACVTLRQDEPEKPRVVAYIVPVRPLQTASTTIRRELRKKLPEHMVPSAFFCVEALPLLANGKVDRLALSALDETRRELKEQFVAPRTPLEETLAGIWTEVLNIKRVGIHDDFFGLGGDSLAAAQIVSRTEHAFQVRLSLPTFLDAPTVADLAVAVVRRLLEQQGTNESLADIESLSDEEVQRCLSEEIQGFERGNHGFKTSDG